MAQSLAHFTHRDPRASEETLVQKEESGSDLNSKPETDHIEKQAEEIVE